MMKSMKRLLVACDSVVIEQTVENKSSYRLPIAVRRNSELVLDSQLESRLFGQVPSRPLSMDVYLMVLVRRQRHDDAAEWVAVTVVALRMECEAMALVFFRFCFADTSADRSCLYCLSDSHSPLSNYFAATSLSWCYDVMMIAFH